MDFSIYHTAIIVRMPRSGSSSSLVLPGSLSAGDPRLHLEPHLQQQQQQDHLRGLDQAVEEEEGDPGEVVLTREEEERGVYVYVGLRNVPLEVVEEDDEEEAGSNVVSVLRADRLEERGESFPYRYYIVGGVLNVLIRSH